MRLFFQSGIADRTAYGVARRAVEPCVFVERNGDVGAIIRTRYPSLACGAVDFSLLLWKGSRPAEVRDPVMASGVTNLGVEQLPPLLQLLSGRGDL